MKLTFSAVRNELTNCIEKSFHLSKPLIFQIPFFIPRNFYIFKYNSITFSYEYIHSYKLKDCIITYHNKIIWFAGMVIWLSYTPVYAQEPILINMGSYRTALAPGQVGDWDNPASWQVWNGEEWNAAILPPDQNHDVFVLQNNEIRLTQHEEARTLYLFSGADPGRKLNLQDFELHVYGALRGFSLDENEIYVIDGSVSPLSDW